MYIWAAAAVPLRQWCREKRAVSLQRVTFCSIGDVATSQLMLSGRIHDENKAIHLLPSALSHVVPTPVVLPAVPVPPLSPENSIVRRAPRLETKTSCRMSSACFDRALTRTQEAQVRLQGTVHDRDTPSLAARSALALLRRPKKARLPTPVANCSFPPHPRHPRHAPSMTASA